MSFLTALRIPLRRRGLNARSMSIAVKTSTKATQLLKADIPPPEDPLLHVLASHIMRHGRRHKANKQVSLMLQHIHALTGAPPMQVLREAIDKAAPSVQVVTRRLSALKSVIGPVPLSERQRVRGAIIWIFRAQMERAGSRLSERLAKEIVGIYMDKSSVLNWKKAAHEVAMVNRAAVKIPQPWELK